MQWWNNFVDWFFSSDAQPVLFSAGVLLVAIVVAGVLAAVVARGSIRRLLAQRDREQKAAAIAALVDAATEASVWNSLTPAEQVLSDRAVGLADLHVRLLPIRGSAVAADWAALQLAEIKRKSATFGYQLEPAVAEFRDRLVDWQNRPARTRKEFLADIERSRADSTEAERALVAQQDAWVAQQHHDQYGDAVVARPQNETQRLISDVEKLDAARRDAPAAVDTPVPAFLPVPATAPRTVPATTRPASSTPAEATEPAK